MPDVKEVPVSFTRKYALVAHTCPVCRTVFQGPKLQVYCGPVCARKAAWERNGGKANEGRREKRQKAQEVAR